VLANVPTHLGGAIDADAADKAARFLQLCDAHRLPVVSLCDTPGFMVGLEAIEDDAARQAAYEKPSPRPTRTGAASTSPRTGRSTTSSTPPTPAAGSSPA